jgi:crotonobetaine/carnitine-CoA ligase
MSRLTATSGSEPRTMPELIRQRATTHAGKTALAFESERWTYADVDRITDSYANALLERGLRQGDHVALFLDNRPEFLWVNWALAKLGAVSVPLNTAARGQQLSYYLDQSDATWVVTEHAALERVLAAAPDRGLAGVVVATDGTQVDAGVLGDGGRLHRLEDLEAGSTDSVVVENAPSSLQALNYTSGTTGPSKAAMSPYGQPVAVGRLVAEDLGYREADTLYTCLPLFHVNALWYTCAAALWSGATIHLDRRFSASGFWPTLAASEATVVNLLGAMTNILMKAPEADHDRAHSLRQSLIAPVNPEMVHGFEQRFGIRVTSLFAATETFPVTILPPDRPAAAPLHSAGRASSLAELRIADADGRALAPGERGEILVRPKQPAAIMRGYYKKPAETQTAFADLWFHTGDRGFLDEDGYLIFVDRIKEVIRRRGENVSSYEVEAALLTHPAIKETAAVPVASELSEDEVMVYVVLQPGASLDEREVIAFAAENMARFMVPRFVRFVDDLPRTPSQKIEKYRLREWAAEHRDELWDRELAGIEVAR